MWTARLVGDRDRVRDLGQSGRVAVAGRGYELACVGPLDPHGGVVVGKPALAARVVVRRHLVRDVGELGEDAGLLGAARLALEHMRIENQ